MDLNALDHTAMDLALDAARAAAAAGETPIGACVYSDAGEIVAVAGNERETLSDPSAHAEIVALRAAAAARGSWRLDGLSLAVTLEPCPMCAGAAVNARIARIVYGCADPKAGAAGSLYNIASDPRLNHRCDVVAGVMADAAARLLVEFFAERRA